MNTKTERKLIIEGPDKKNETYIIEVDEDKSIKVRNIVRFICQVTNQQTLGDTKLLANEILRKLSMEFKGYYSGQNPFNEAQLLVFLKVQSNVCPADFHNIYGEKKGRDLFRLFASQGHNLIEFFFNKVNGQDRADLLEFINFKATDLEY